MNEQLECLIQYKKLREIIESDFKEISKGLGGELLECYRSLLEEEQEELNKMILFLGKNYYDFSAS